ncbi:hypothetical protein AN239_07715 [Neisseria gonorrhoeae]|nr:hypothetical protein AN239_07715 [Neisseria gonorrhoeae]
MPQNRRCVRTACSVKMPSETPVCRHPSKEILPNGRLQILFPDESALTLMHILKRGLPDTPAIGIKTKSKTCLNVKSI